MSAPVVLVSGASGGIGSAIAIAFARQGARLILVGRNATAVAGVAKAVEAAGGTAFVLLADIVKDDPGQLAGTAIAAYGAVDMVVNCAGMQYFGAAEAESAGGTAQLFATNVVAPIQLVQALLPHLQSRSEAHVINVGSIFGSIGFPCFASYSASKFALRGYSEALRRELLDGPVQVHYVAPRYTRTGFNRAPVARMAEALGMHQDSPESVADQVLAAVRAKRADTYLGWPEKLFVRINAVLPRLVDRALVRKGRRMRPFTSRPLVESN